LKLLAQFLIIYPQLSCTDLLNWCLFLHL